MNRSESETSSAPVVGAKQDAAAAPDYAAIAQRAHCASGCGTPRECVCAYLTDAAEEIASLLEQNRVLRAQLDAAHDALEFVAVITNNPIILKAVHKALALVGERQPDSVHRPVTSPCPSPLSGDTSEAS